MSVSTIFGASLGSASSTSGTTPTQYNTPTSNNEYGNAVSTAGNDTLTESDFLNLMDTQLENQDPTDPISDEDMASQMAQFASLQGIDNMSSTMSNMSGLNEITAAAGMIGQTVTTDLVDSSGNPVGGVVTAAGVTNGNLMLTVDGQQIGMSDITGIQQNSSTSSNTQSGS